MGKPSKKNELAPKEKTAAKSALQEYKALAKKIKPANPREADVRALRDLLANNPDLWRETGDLAHFSVRAVLGRLPVGLRVSMEFGTEQIKKQYGYADAPSMEKLLIDHVLISWLQLQKTTMNYEASMIGDVPLAVAALWEHRLDSATRRYLLSMATLAKVRKLRGADDDSERERQFLILDKPWAKAEISASSETQGKLPPPTDKVDQADD